MAWHHLITRTVSTTATALLLGLGAAAGIAHLQGIQFLSVQSGSMVPAFSKGDLVAITSAPNKQSVQYAVGDVITFINPHNTKQTITHRLQKVIPKGSQVAGKPIRQTTFVTKGDANPASDTPIHARNIIGKVDFSLPLLGFVFDFARQPLGLMLLIYVPALSIIWSELRRLAEYYRTQAPQTYTATTYAPDGNSTKRQDARKKPVKPALATATVITIAAAGLAVPIAHAALIDAAVMQDTTIKTKAAVVAPATLNHPIISRVAFGNTSSSNNSSNTTNNTNIQVTNNTTQSASSGSAATSNGGNATSGNASNSNSTSTNISVTTGNNSTSGNSSATPAVITIYNPTDAPINLSSWKLTDNAGVQTLPTGSVVAGKTSMTFTWPITGGLSRAGDRLMLSNVSNTPVDALSWGTDITHLNPAIATSTSTLNLNRGNTGVDTDTAADWTVSP